MAAARPHGSTWPVPWPGEHCFTWPISPSAAAVCVRCHEPWGSFLFLLPKGVPKHGRAHTPPADTCRPVSHRGGWYRGGGTHVPGGRQRILPKMLQSTSFFGEKVQKSNGS